MKINYKPVIKWSGSKRSQATEIISKIPKYNKYFEPFLGGGSIMYAINPSKATCSDICEPLIKLWLTIQNDPVGLADYYENQWNKMQSEGYQVYYEIREEFNNDFSPYALLFLSRTCVNGLIRFNKDGKFNNSLHYSRKGIDPKTLRNIISDWSIAIQNIEFITSDYKEATKDAKNGDFVYLDPPYFNTKGRYYNLTTIDFEEFFEYLRDLNTRGVNWALSFDGKTTAKDYSIELPKDLFVNHYYLHAGNSAFKKVMDKQKNVIHESLYTNY